MNHDDDQRSVPDSVAIAAVCLVLWLAGLLGVILWHAIH